MTRYDELKHLVPPRLQAILTAARRDPTSSAVSSFRFWMRRHKRDVDELRARVDARIKHRTEEYSRIGLSVDRPDFITAAMRDEMELLYQLDYGVSVATDEFKAIVALAERHGH